MRILALGVSLALVAGCGPRVPDSGQAAVSLASPAAPQSQLQTAAPVLAASDGSITLQELQAAGIGPATAGGAGLVPLDATGSAARAAGAGTAPPGFPAETSDARRVAAGRGTGIEATPGNAAPVIVNNPGLSNEQDFDAVSAERSIAGDAARQTRLAAAYEVVTPGALPDRAVTEAGPNIVAYALQTTNARGQSLYQRFAPSQSRFQRNCAAYASPDAAQRDFLARGGPERDRQGLDPDGDGFACGWDPAPFRALRGG